MYVYIYMYILCIYIYINVYTILQYRNIIIYSNVCVKQK